MKHANGYGSVSKLTGNRRKPFRVQIHVGYKDDGTPIRQTIGYTTTREEGKELLAEYHNKQFNLELDNLCFDFLYQEWFKYKEKQNLSEARLRKYSSYRKHYKIIENKPFNSITKNDLQLIVDRSNCSGKTQREIVNVYHQLYEFAKYNNVKVLNDVSKFVVYDKIVPSTLHQPFTDDEINLIWKHVDNDIAKLILINIYTGIRPGEFFKISEVHEDYFITGSKTEAGKDRVIPLHRSIKQIFANCYQNHTIDECFNEDGLYIREKRFFDNLGIKHTPYDCRHTFATLCSRYELNEHIVKLIMGHHISDLTKRVYTHKMIEELIDEVNKISV